MAFPEPDPCDEAALAQRLLVALEQGDEDGARLLKGEILGLHFAKLRSYVARRLEDMPKAHMEEVFGEAAYKMLRELGKPEKVRWVTAGKSFAPLFFKIARFETVNYWRSGDLDKSRREYRDDRLSNPGLDASALNLSAEGDAFERLAEIDAARSDAVKVAEAAGRVGGLDGLLIELIDIGSISLRDVEQLLVLAQWDDAEAALSEALALASVDERCAEDHLTLIRECPAAHPITYNNLKVAIHRARTRLRGALEGDQMDSL